MYVLSTHRYTCTLIEGGRTQRKPTSCAVRPLLLPHRPPLDHTLYIHKVPLNVGSTAPSAPLRGSAQHIQRYFEWFYVHVFLCFFFWGRIGLRAKLAVTRIPESNHHRCAPVSADSIRLQDTCFWKYTYPHTWLAKYPQSIHVSMRLSAVA